MKRVCFCNFSWQYDRSVFLPLPVAMLAAYAKADPELAEFYTFDLDFQFLRDDPQNLADDLIARGADVVGFSTYIWNEQLSLEVARRIKEARPGVLIVFGGQSISQWPEVNEAFLRQHPFIDVAVRGEGEITFAELLLRDATRRWRIEAGGAELATLGEKPVAGTSYITYEHGTFVMAPERKRERDLSVFPSPFLDGTFDIVMQKHPEFEFQGLWETNRGCPYDCSFCSWSALALGAKIGLFPIDRLLRELDWFAQKRITHVYGCDANWEQLPRDVQITDAIVAQKAAKGYPKSFFVNTRKNATTKTFAVAKKFYDAGLSKSFILSMQSTDETTLENIKRGNIKLSHYHELQRLSREAGVPTCSELILGLPGETLASFCKGIEYELDVRQFTMFIYFCVVLPGSEMAQPQYLEKFGIKTASVTIASNHADLAENDRSVSELEDVVVETASLPYQDWLQCNRVAWFLNVFVCMHLGVFPLYWLKKEHGVKITDFAIWALERMKNRSKYTLLADERDRLEAFVNSITSGKPTVSRAGIEDTLPIRWPLEEASFLAISENLTAFYTELYALIAEYKPDVDGELLLQIMGYQAARIVRQEAVHGDYAFDWNLPSYFDRVMKLDDTATLEKKDSEMTVAPAKFDDYIDFQKRGVWYSRRGGKFLYEVKFRADN